MSLAVCLAAGQTVFDVVTFCFYFEIIDSLSYLGGQVKDVHLM